MAEVCCEVVVSGAEAEVKAICQTRSRAARRRRDELRRWKIVAGAEAVAVAAETRRKRRAPDGGSGARAKELDISCSEELGPSTHRCPPRHGVTSVRGRRREMEDAVSVRPDLAAPPLTSSLQDEEESYHFYGVFDGHGCSHVAEACKERMHEMVAEELEAMKQKHSSPPLPDGWWAAAMERSFSRMDAEVMGGGAAGGGEDVRDPNCRCEASKCDHVGSTALVAVVGGSRIVVANCGDSRAVLCRNGLPVPLSSDQKPDRADELERIQKAGGRVIFWDGARVLGVLAMSRAIGDGYLKPFVVADPEVTETEREEGDECLILASDGLWDVVSNETACEVARMCLRRRGRSDNACAEAAALLTKLALARHTSDNVTVVVVDLRTTAAS